MGPPGRGERAQRTRPAPEGGKLNFVSGSVKITRAREKKSQLARTRMEFLIANGSLYREKNRSFQIESVLVFFKREIVKVQASRCEAFVQARTNALNRAVR